MTRKLTASLVVLGLALGVAFVLYLPKRATPFKYEYVSQEGNFRVRFPKIPEEKENIMDGKKAVSVTCEDAEAGYQLIFHNFGPHPDQVMNDKERIEKLRDDTHIRFGSGKVRREKWSLLDGKHHVLDCEIVEPKHRKFGVTPVIRTKFVVVGKTVFMLWVMSHDSWDKWHHADQFFSSFELIK